MWGVILKSHSQVLAVPVRLAPHGQKDTRGMTLKNRGQLMNNKAFTLIELLVAVLIIGILAAIAVPQYQKAKYKTIFSELRLAFKDITQAQQLYYLNNGKYAGRGEEDKIDAPYKVENNMFIISSNLSCYLGSSGGPIIICNRSTTPRFGFYYYIYRADPATYCYASTSDKNAADKFCQLATGQEANSSHTYWGTMSQSLL